MAPNELRTLSWRTFKLTVIGLIAGLIIGMGMPANPSFKGYADPVHVWLVRLQLLVLGVSQVANLISLASGAVAWRKGGKHCAWIILSAILLLVFLAVLFVLLLPMVGL